MGASWEGFVLEQIVGLLSAMGVRGEPYYFRTSDGHEIDLVLDFGTERWALEIKLTTSPSPHDMSRLDKAADMIGATRKFLVTRTPHDALSDTRWSCCLQTLLKELPRILP